MTTFDSTKASLNDLLREIKEGNIQLPDFQRGWVGDDDHTRYLLVTTAFRPCNPYLKPIVLKGWDEGGLYIHADWVQVIGSEA